MHKRKRARGYSNTNLHFSFLMNHTTYFFSQLDHVYIAGEKYNEMTSEMNVNNGEYG